MYVGKIMSASPLLAIALCVSLATILWCILLARRQRNGLDKILTGLLGLIAIYEALRILKDSGTLMFPVLRKLDGFADLIIASLSLIAALVLRISSIDRAATKAQLRLVEANEKPVELGKGATAAVPELKHMLFDACPLATFAVDLHGAVTYWNAAAEALTGRTRDEVLGHPLPFAANGPLLHKSGDEIESAIWTSPIHCANGIARGFLTIAAGSADLAKAGVGEGRDSQPEVREHSSLTERALEYAGPRRRSDSSRQSTDQRDYEQHQEYQE